MQIYNSAQRGSVETTLQRPILTYIEISIGSLTTIISGVMPNARNCTVTKCKKHHYIHVRVKCPYTT